MLEGFAALTEAVRAVAPPGAPPRTSIDGAAVGLSFLDTVLRLNHVRRLTDRLTIVEHGAAQRTTEVDVDLGMLDENQRQAARLFQRLVSQGQSPRFTPASTTWVPVARISRQSVAPVDVLDACGQKLPRLTQYETSRLLASALFHLLRGILAGQPDARIKGTDLNRLLFTDHRARWLIQAALQTLLTDRNLPHKTLTDQNSTRLAEHRDLALRVLNNSKEILANYRQLLNIAVNEYLLVVALDDSVDEHLLTYDSPLPVDRTVKQPALSLSHKLRVNRRGYLAEYHSMIPASLRSYHLVVESEHGVDIERMYLSTDADRVLVKELSSDLDTLAGKLTKAKTSHVAKPGIAALELSLDTTLRQVAELLRRKAWDADQAGFSLTSSRLTRAVNLGRAAVNGEIVSSPNGQSQVAVTVNPSAAPDALQDAAKTLLDQELGHDLALENDPVINRAHAYWRRHAGRLPDGAPQITIRAGLIMRDTSATGPKMVFGYASVIALISLVLAVLLTGSAVPYLGAAAAEFGAIEHREAVIAVLLLVPGFLYTRLTMPDKHSISGYLTAFPRLVAHVSIGSMALVAAAVAAGSSGMIVAALFAVALLAPLGTAGVMISPVIREWRTRGRDRKAGHPATNLPTGRELWLIRAPKWVHDDKDANENDRWDPDIVFRSTGGNSDG